MCDKPSLVGFLCAISPAADLERCGPGPPGALTTTVCTMTGTPEGVAAFTKPTAAFAWAEYTSSSEMPAAASCCKVC